jgi:hypothetical protein
VIVEFFTGLVGIGFVAYAVRAPVEIMRAMKADEGEWGRDHVDDR